MAERRRCKNCVRDCFYGLGRVVYDQVLECAKLETSELCSEWNSVAQKKGVRLWGRVNRRV